MQAFWLHQLEYYTYLQFLCNNLTIYLLWSQPIQAQSNNHYINCATLLLELNSYQAHQFHLALTLPSPSPSFLTFISQGGLLDTYPISLQGFIQAILMSVRRHKKLNLLIEFSNSFFTNFFLKDVGIELAFKLN